MSAFIVGGIALIVGTNWFYSRFCEGPRQLLRDKRQRTTSRSASASL